MKASILEEKLVCSHCGENCEDEPIIWRDKPFCCEGCKMVYEILDENELNIYYELEKTPGIQRKTIHPRKYDYLDHQDIVRQLLDFQDGQVAKVTLFVPAIHCSSCIWLLENLHQLNANVLHTQVNFLKKQVTITFQQEKLSLRTLIELLATLGYEPEIHLASNKVKPRVNRSLMLKMGVAGFCFGNTMLLSLPEYLDTKFQIDEEYKVFFGLLNLLLAIPVFLYSASDYFASAWKSIRQRFLNMDVPIALGIIALFSRSAYEILSQTGAGYMDSLTGLVFFLLIGKWFQNKTYQALSYERDYQSYFPIAVTRLNAGQEESIPLQEVQTGGHLLIRHQEIIPADALLLEGEALIDYSFVTGESVPVEKQTGDLLYAGGRQTGGNIIIEVQKPVANSYLTQLWNQEAFGKKQNSSLSSLTNSVGRNFTYVVLTISTATALFWFFHDSSMVINTVTAVLIIACPCALALSIPFTMGHTVRVFGKKGLYLKNTNVVEQMAKVKDIVFDKTGTITQARPQHLQLIGDKLSLREQSLIRSVVRNSTHPLSKAIYQSLSEDLPLQKVEDYKEIPGKGIQARMQDQEIQIGSSVFVTGAQQQDQQASRVYVKLNGKVKGYYEFRNLYRPGFEEVMASLRQDHTLHLLSGDNDQEKSRLQPYFQHLYFQQSPVDKLNYVKKLEEAGHQTMMVGDGLNDAGALKQSQLGIAIADNIYHFSPACDAILDAQYFGRLDQYLHFSKISLRIVKSAFLLSFCYNVVGISFAVSGMLTPLVAAILMPLSSATVVGYTTLAVNWKAKRLLP